MIPVPVIRGIKFSITRLFGKRKWRKNSAQNSLDRATEHDFRCHVTSLASRARFSRRKFSKETYILRMPSKPCSVHSVHSGNNRSQKHDYRLNRVFLFRKSPKRCAIDYFSQSASPLTSHADRLRASSRVPS